MPRPKAGKRAQQAAILELQAREQKARREQKPTTDYDLLKRTQGKSGRAELAAIPATTKPERKP